jgi:hypothetical protein
LIVRQLARHLDRLAAPCRERVEMIRLEARIRVSGARQKKIRFGPRGREADCCECAMRNTHARDARARQAKALTA